MNLFFSKEQHTRDGCLGNRCCWNLIESTESSVSSVESVDYNLLKRWRKRWRWQRPQSGIKTENFQHYHSPPNLSSLNVKRSSLNLHHSPLTSHLSSLNAHLSHLIAPALPLLPLAGGLRGSYPLSSLTHYKDTKNIWHTQACKEQKSASESLTYLPKPPLR